MRLYFAHAALFSFCLILTAGSTEAQPALQKRIQYSSGTGFFITRDGYLLTNDHVIAPCPSGAISLSGAVEGEATIIGSDKEHDLALLRSKKQPPDSVTLLANMETLQAGNHVLLLGYPLSSTSLQLATAEITGLKGPLGEEKWLQFSSAAQKGNSGGPLLDHSGNLVGVVTGKTQLLSMNPMTGKQEVVQRSDVAISLETVRQFLEKHHIRYRLSQSLARRMDTYLEDRAKHFTVHIKCIVSEELLTN